MAYKVREITIRLVVDNDEGPVADSIEGVIIESVFPDTVVSVEIVNEEARDATDEEAESMGWTDIEGSD